MQGTIFKLGETQVGVQFGLYITDHSGQEILDYNVFSCGDRFIHLLQFGLCVALNRVLDGIPM